jgi:methylated-DNA-[protein]-cysteine S-methyltransferase
MATEFERRVYERTREIPLGMVTTYGEIAKAIGTPNASRAVGNALNRNPLPVEVPCHRVVRSDMSLGGFSRGAGTKERLLRGEGILVVNGRVAGRIFRFNL